MFDMPDDHSNEQTEQDRQKQLEYALHEQRLRHERFVDEMSKEQLVTFVEILNMFAHQGKRRNEFIHYFMGQVSATLRHKHGACMCGEDHMAADHEALVATRQEMGLPSAGPLVDMDALQKSVDEETLMKEYGLTRRIGGTFSCTGCGIEYQSIDDRMLRQPGPDGCSGCKAKAAHG